MPTPLFSGLAALGLVWLSSAFAHAATGGATASFAFDLPFGANEATPIWLGHPATPVRAFPTLDLPITPPDPTQGLLLTVIFQEQEGSFLRITWTGNSGAQILTNNFYEGIGMGNRRSLLIPAQTLNGPGTLTLQEGAGALSIAHVKLEWLAKTDELASPAVRDLLVTPESGSTVYAPLLDGQAAQDLPPAWTGQVVDLPLSNTAQRIEDGMDFNVEIERTPNAARLVFQEAGLAWGQHLVVWINQKRAGIVTPTVPDLKTDGFFAGGTSDSDGFVGWREGSLYLPGKLFTLGLGAIQLSVEDDVSADDAGTALPAAVTALAVKNVVLQFQFSTDSAAETPITNAAPAPPTAASELAPETPAIPSTNAVPSEPANPDLP